MINLTLEQIEYLNDIGISVSGYLDSDDLDGLLEEIDDAIIENIVNNDDEPDDVGIELQKLYDLINEGID